MILLSIYFDKWQRDGFNLSNNVFFASTVSVVPSAFATACE
jgi:hypothetical protein